MKKSGLADSPFFAVPAPSPQAAPVCSNIPTSSRAKQSSRRLLEEIGGQASSQAIKTPCKQAIMQACMQTMDRNA